MPTTRQGRRPTKRSIAAIVLVLVGVAIGMFVIASALAKLGIFQTVVLTAGYLVGAIFGQAKDVANRKTFSGDLWQDLQDFFFEAWSDENGAAFIFRSLEWGGLLIAATFVAKLITG